MRVMMIVTIPNEPCNTLIREGKLGGLLGRILEETKPEAVYFSEAHGLRTVFLVAHAAADASYPALAEPWWLSLEAKVEMRVCMLPQELQSAGLDAIGERWK
jgi:hypothetical protein